MPLPKLQVFCISANILGGTKVDKSLENDEVLLQRALLEHITRACEKPLFVRELEEMLASPNMQSVLLFLLETFHDNGVVATLTCGGVGVIALRRNAT